MKVPGYSARWRSGDAEVCKTSYTGSIPVRASKFCGMQKTLANPFCPCYKLLRCKVIPGSSVVEQAAVNRLVAGSNPARGAILSNPATPAGFLLPSQQKLCLFKNIKTTTAKCAEETFVRTEFFQPRQKSENHPQKAPGTGAMQNGAGKQVGQNMHAHLFPHL